MKRRHVLSGFAAVAGARLVSGCAGKAGAGAGMTAGDGAVDALTDASRRQPGADGLAADAGGSPGATDARAVDRGASDPPAASDAMSRPGALGIPGPYPGRVVAVRHPGSWVGRRYQAEPISNMIRKGLMELTGAPDHVAAWRVLVEPGDVVGIKLNGVGRPFVVSSAEAVREIIAGLMVAGVKAQDIVAYDRYRVHVLEAGYDRWLPPGVRWTYAAEAYDDVQLDMTGYDAEHFIEADLRGAAQNPSDPRIRRSYASRFIARDVNKLVNLPVLKDHASSGVTLALKNLSHGLVNNVERSHSATTPMMNATATFIPTVVSMPVIRQKTVLNILDGVRGAWNGGPGIGNERNVWDHYTMYFATDPVALDKTGRKAIEEKRIAMGLRPFAQSPDLQPQHIENAAARGLGIADDARIDLRRFDLV